MKFTQFKWNKLQSKLKKIGFLIIKMNQVQSEVINLYWINFIHICGHFF